MGNHEEEPCAPVHAKQNVQVIFLMVNAMKQLSIQVLLGAHVNDKAICSKLIWINMGFFHVPPKIQALMKYPNYSFLQDWVVNCSVTGSDWDALKLAQITMKALNVSCVTCVGNQLERSACTTCVGMRIHLNLTQLLVIGWMLNHLGLLDLHGYHAACIDFACSFGVWVVSMSVLCLLAHG